MTEQEYIGIDDLRAWKIYERAPKLQVRKCKKSSNRWQSGYQVAQIKLNCYSWLCPDHSAPPESVKYLVHNQLGYAAVNTEYDIENANLQIQRNSVMIEKTNMLIREKYEGREEKEQAHYPETESKEPRAYFANIATSESCGFGYLTQNGKWKRCKYTRTLISPNPLDEAYLPKALSYRNYNTRLISDSSNIDGLRNSWRASWPCFRCSVPWENFRPQVYKIKQNAPDAMIWGSWIETFGEDCLNKNCRHVRPTYWIVECFIGGMKTRRICWVNRHQDGPICTNQYYGEGPFKGKQIKCGNIYGTMPIFAYDPDSDGMLMCIWPTTKALETRKSDPFNDTDGDASHIKNYHPIYTMSDYPTLSVEASEKPVPFKNMKLDLKYITHPEEDMQEAIEEGLTHVTQGTQEMALTATAAASASGTSRKRQASAEPPQLPEGKRM